MGFDGRGIDEAFKALLEDERNKHFEGMQQPTAVEECPHLSETGDEGPIVLLGRFPRRWAEEAML